MIKSLINNKFSKVILLLGFCVVLALSLVTYSELDSSLNTYSNSYPENILGYFGSYFSDLFIQIFGLCSWLIVISLLLLAVSVMKNVTYDGIKQRIIFSFLSAFLSSIILSYYLPDFGSNLGVIFVSKTYVFEKWILNLLFTITFIICFSFFIYGAGIPFIYLLDFLLFIKQIFVIKNYQKTPKKLSSTQYVNSPKKLMTERIIQSPTIDFEQGDEEESWVNSENQVKSHNKSEEDISEFILPDSDLLSNAKDVGGISQTEEELNMQAEELLNVLKDFGVKGNIIEINQGPVVTLYEFEPAAGTKSSRVIGLADDIARSLSALSTRIAVIPGRNVLGIELPNKTREFFRIKGLLESKIYQDSHIQLPIILGKDLGGKPYVVDLAKMPHLLVAGTTGSGKSVAINTMIVSLLYRHTPKECRFIMIDPKMLELSVYDGIPHLLAPVVTEPSKAIVALKWAVREMENRYRLMSNVGVRNVQGYNQRISEAIKKGEELKRTVQTGFDIDTGKPIFESIPIEMEQLPFIVIIVDEMADLMLVAGKEIESSIQRLAQMARAAGIHLIMATQRPSVDVITGVIKANFPSRVSFKVTSKIDSRTILGEQGAEQLLGMGDMLYMGTSSKISRIHGPFVEDEEVERISRFLKDQAVPDYIQAVTTSEEEVNPLDDAMIDIDDMSDDGLYKQALQIVKKERKSSTSYIQRSLRIGYNRAAIIVERMEKEGILSSPSSTGKREILIEEE